MSDIARLRDADGKVHFTARDSKFARTGLANGTLVDLDKEVPSAPADASNGDDLNPRLTDSRSRKRERAAGNTDDGNSEGVAESASDS